MAADDLDLSRKLALIYETERAVALLDEGIRGIASWCGGEDGRILALSPLAQGFERFLKVTYALIQLNVTGTLPTVEQVKKFNHNLTKLLDRVVEACRRDSGFMDDADSQSAMDFLATDNHWREVLNILTDVGSSGRYHDLDTMLDGQLASQSPLDRWCALEVSFLQTDPSWNELMVSDQVEFARQWYPALAAKQTETLQRAARAIARMWTSGPARLHDQGLTGIIGRFSQLTEDDLSTPAT